jgi:hypothetical protein
MAFRTHLLVVANRTADSPELIAALERRAEHAPLHVTLLAPVRWSERTTAQRRLDRAVTRLRAAGIESEGVLGDEDPIVAVQETWNPGRFDGVVVSTLASPVSRWMQADLPHRVAKLTDCNVEHVQSAPPRPRDTRPPTPPATRPPLLPSVLALMRAQTRRGSKARA